MHQRKLTAPFTTSIPPRQLHKVEALWIYRLTALVQLGLQRYAHQHIARWHLLHQTVSFKPSNVMYKELIFIS